MQNKEGLWKLSPSSLYAYTECPACFWVDNHFKKPPMLPLLLNTAMDSILKHRYDQFRKDKTFPPEARALLKDGIKPFMDLDKLNEWREKISALEVVDKKVGYVLRGKIDDVLLDARDHIVPADYKSSGNAPKEDKQKFYRDQLAAYGFMFAHHGFTVGTRAYLLHYFVKDKTNPSLAVEFAAHVDPVVIDLPGLERKLAQMVELLNGPYPGHNGECERCEYHHGRTEQAVSK